ncbi:DUF6090 family protein [Winogradskyella litorisediminis]|uniref:DUF6090 family protein n=1 Tax=Winogradskyella litorisediminis TaxID=1156618 RepID=A0ABW3N299_9FLAO
MKFFNKLRNKAMSKKRIGKYLAYAVGEIILVVIGILIAVSINDYQKEKSDREELNRILSLVKKDMLNDIKLLKEVLYDFKYNEKLMSKMLDDSINNSEYLYKCYACRYILSEYSTMSINTKGRNLLKTYNRVPIDKRPLVDSINLFYDNYIDHIDMNNQFMKDEIIEFNKYLRDNKTWFKAYFNDGRCNEDCANYFKSQEYLNRITLANAVISDALIPYFESYKIDAEKYIESIDKL